MTFDEIRGNCYGCQYVRLSNEVDKNCLPVKVDCIFDLHPNKKGKCTRRVDSLEYKQEQEEEAWYEAYTKSGFTL
jgi:hypothetical protein